MTFERQMRQRRNLPLTPEEVADIPISERDQDEWQVMAMARPIPVSATLTGMQWTVILASLRASMAMTTEPGLVRLAHDDLYSQVVRKKTGD